MLKIGEKVKILSRTSLKNKAIKKDEKYYFPYPNSPEDLLFFNDAMFSYCEKTYKISSIDKYSGIIRLYDYDATSYTIISQWCWTEDMFEPINYSNFDNYWHWYCSILSKEELIDLLQKIKKSSNKNNKFINLLKKYINHYLNKKQLTKKKRILFNQNN